MRIGIMAAVVLVGCGGSTGSGGSGGSGGTGGSGGAGGGAGGGTAADIPIATCTPAGFATAPSTVDHLPKPGLANAADHSAYVTFLSNDGGLGDISAKITVEDDFSRDGGATVPAGVTARFNGCPLASIFDVPGVGREFSAMGAATFTPTAGRFVAFEVVDAQGALLFRRSVGLAQVLPRITSVTNPTGPMATVTFTAVPDAGVDNAYLSAFKRIGTGGLQSTGFFTNPPINTGTTTFPVTNQTNRFDLQLNCGPVRLVSRFDTP